MRMRRSGLLLGLLVAITSPCCSGSAGDEDTEILVPFESLGGGMVFATRQINGANGYDLFWAPVPTSATPAFQITVKLTDSGGNDWQPSVAFDGNGIAFARQDDGILLITESGRVRRISSTKDTTFKDSLPAVSKDASLVAWVREDTARPIGDSGFVETSIMLANADGSDERVLNARTGVIQDAPVFDPTPRSNQVAWSEFAVEGLSASGPVNYGIWVHDFVLATGRYICQDPEAIIDGVEYRCFGQHLAWPEPNTIIVPQVFLEIPVNGGPLNTIYPAMIESVTQQQIGIPQLAPFNQGFHNPFPISASYDGVSRVVFDGLFDSIAGNEPSLGYFVIGADGGGAFRINLQNYFGDIDAQNTSGYFFSVATPQFIPRTVR